MFPVYEAATIAPPTYTILQCFCFPFSCSSLHMRHNYLQMYLSINVCIFFVALFCTTALYVSLPCLLACINMQKDI